MNIKYTEEEKREIRAYARQIANNYLAFEQRQENGKVITEDDVLNVRIAVENCEDVNQFINQL